VTQETVRAVINTRQCDIGTREGLPELGILEVQGGARGFRKYKGDGLDGGDEMGDELMGGRSSGSSSSNYLRCCDGKLGQAKRKGLPETVK
jgi:hypothetical protein